MSGSDDDSSGTSYVTIKVDPDPGFELRFDALTATEELGRPFLITVDVSSGQVKGNIGTMLGSNVTVTMTGADGTSRTYFNGILARAAFAGRSGGVYRYHLELRPLIWLLTRVQDCKIFQNQSPFAIITGIFSSVGVTPIEDKRINQAGSVTLDYCVQYRESTFDFVMRLMEEFGIYYYFTHADGQHTLVLSDDPNSHTALPTPIPFDFSQTEMRSVEDHIWEWTSDLHLQPGAYTYQDYNFTTPAADLQSKSLKSGPGKFNTFEVYDYPGFYDTTDNGQKLATVRMQDFSARVQLFDGRSNARSLRCGAKFTLSDFPDTALNAEYLVTRAVTTLTIAEGGSDTRGSLVDSHRVEFSAIPGTTPFQLERRTRKPMIRGPQTAKVVGNSGDEITTDSYGRIKVQFYWDRVGTNDQNSSCWIRVAQSWAGAGWGSIFIPRIGMEVVVEFLEGNPDRPLVTGVVYNATQTVPNPLPDKQVLTTLRTNSSKGGGGFNELTFDDTKGSELVFFQTQKDYHKQVLNSETVDITQDTTTTVKQGNRSVTVSQGNDTHTVSQGDRSVTVTQGKDTHTVQKDQSVTVQQGNQSMTVSQGNQTVTISVGNHKLDVTAGGSKTTTGQAFEVTANTSISLTATESITLTCGPSSIKLSPSGVTISGPQISGSADASMSLNGGGSMSLNAGMININ